MSLSAIVEAILVSGEAQVQEIEAQCRMTVHGILAEARLEAEQAQADACASALAPAARERSRLLQRARLEALRSIGSAREALVEAALDRVHGRLAALRSSPGYAAILARLAVEARDELAATLGEGSVACFEVSRRDREILERSQKTLFPEIPVTVGLDGWGGVTAKSQDGRVVVINTLESRLERATPTLRHMLALMFEDENPHDSRRTERLELARA
jgi:V/A-type H+-transporting ATPase subunit E